MVAGIRTQLRRHSRVARRALFLEALEARNLLASYTTPEDTSLVVTDLAPAIGEVAAEPLHGKLTVFATGGFSYAPAENYFGADRFTYRPINPTTASGLVEVELAVTPVNDAPVANDDNFTTRSGNALTISGAGLLENDRDVDSNALSVLLPLNGGPTHGSLLYGGNPGNQSSKPPYSISPSGNIVYIPSPGFVGRDSFVYVASDGQAISAATVTINVEAVNDSPAARNDSYEVKQGGTLSIQAPGVLANDSGTPGIKLLASLVSGVGEGKGSLTLNADGSLNYVPPVQFSGKVSFTYRAILPEVPTLPVTTNPATLSNVATVTITVVPLPSQEARPDQYGMEQGGVLAVAAPGVLGNDGATAARRLYASVVSAPLNGTLTLSLDGSFVYTPKAEFFGTETFTYRASDQPPTVADANTAPANSSVAKVSITVRAKGPEARPDKYEINFGQKLEVAAPGVLGNDSSANGSLLFASLVEKPRGELTLNTNGSFVYTPPVGFSGTDTFKYRASVALSITDPAGTAPTTIGSIAVVTIYVRPGARDDQYVAVQGTPLSVTAPGVLANDGSNTTNDRALYAYPVRGPEHGTLVLNPDGSFVYTPAGDYTGPDTFTYRASVISPESTSPILEGSVATVHIHVRPPITLLIARDDEYAVQQGGALAIKAPGVLANDEPQSGEAFLVDNPGHGQLTFNRDGSFTYVPSPDFSGEDKFTYRIMNTVVTGNLSFTGPLPSNTATVFIKVGPIASQPIAQNDRYEMKQGTELKIAAPGVLKNDGLQLNARLVATLESEPTNGTLTLNADGSFVYVPRAGFAGVETFKYRARLATATPATDPTAPSSLTDATTGNVATVTIVVHAVNPIPRAQDDKYTASAGHELIVERARGVLANDGAATINAPLVARLESEPGNGRVTLNANGSFTYVPETGFVGIDSFTYRASIASTAAGSILPDSGSVATVYINVVRSPNAFHNVVRPKDVNGDRMVSTIDAVLVINRMNNPTPFSMAEGEASGLPFYDVNGDGMVTTIDALMVINELNSPQTAVEADEAEGESSAAIAADENLEATLAALTCDAEELAARKRARTGL